MFFATTYHVGDGTGKTGTSRPDAKFITMKVDKKEKEKLEDLVSKINQEDHSDGSDLFNNKEGKSPQQDKYYKH